MERDPGGTVQQRYHDPLKWNVVRRATFDPRPTRFQDHSQLPQEEVTAFSEALEEAGLPDCGFLKLLPKYWPDAEVTGERLLTLVDEVNQFYEELAELINPDRQPYEVPNTEMQHLSHKWQEIRELLFTASIAKQVASLSSPEAKMNFLRRKLYDVVKVTKAMQYGIDNEDKARAKYMKKKEEEDAGVMFNRSGLWVDQDYPFLGCTPDDIVIPSGNQPRHLVEYKCLYVVRSIHPKDFHKHLDAGRKSRFPLGIKNNKLYLKRTHSHFYQVQMQMGITQTTLCDYVVWSRKGTVIVKVHFDADFWASLKKVLIFRHRNLFAVEYILKRASRDLLPIELDLVEEDDMVDPDDE